MFRLSLLAVTLAALMVGCAAPEAPSPSPTVPVEASPTPTSPIESPSPVPTSSPGESPEPQPTATPAPPPPTSTPVVPLTVSSPAQAAALVLASNARFHGVSPPREDVGGQCCWYQALPSLGYYSVRVGLGWDDCPAGCISNHEWRFRVDPDGTVTELETEGDEPIGVEPRTDTGPAQVTITALAGPVCPVEQVPPDPACAPRPVSGAEVIVRAPSGAELQRGTTNHLGQIVLIVESGAYYLEPQPVAGLMGTAEPIAFSVAAGDELVVWLDYDTGIR